jgi:hypothetical protein
VPTEPTITIGPYIQGEIPDPIVVIFEDNTGVKLDLTGYTTPQWITRRHLVSSGFAFTGTDPAAVVNTAVVNADQSAHKGEVTYTWVLADMSTAGDYEAEMWVTAPSGKPVRAAGRYAYHVALTVVNPTGVIVAGDGSTSVQSLTSTNGPNNLHGRTTLFGDLVHASQTVTETVLVSGINASLSEDVYVTLTANRVMGLPLNGVAGDRLHLIVTQGGSGNYTLAAGAGVTFTNVALNGAVGAQTELSLTCTSPTTWILATNPPLNKVVSATANWKGDWGCKGDSVTDDGASFVAGIAALPVNAGTAFGPVGTYLTSLELDFTNTPVHMEGEGWTTWIKPTPGFSASSDIIKVKPTIGTRDWQFRKMRIGGGASALGRHGIHFDYTDAGNIASTYDTIVEFVLVDPTLTGYSLYIHSTSSNLTGGMFYSQIHANNLESILGQFIGDTISMEYNYIQGAHPSIDVSQIVGAGNMRIVHNTLVGTQGMIIVHSGVAPYIHDNTCEQAANNTEANGAMIDILGDNASVWHPQITNNQIQVDSGKTGVLRAINLGATTDAVVDCNRIDVQSGDHVTVGASSSNASIDTGPRSRSQYLTNHVIGAAVITDNGTGTKYDFDKYTESDIATGSHVTLTTNTGANVTSISLPPGEYDIRANFVFDGGATTTITVLQGGLSLVSATRDFLEGRWVSIPMFGNVGLAFLPTMLVGPQRFVFATTTTVYMVAYATFGVAAMTVYGRLSARRIA